MAKKKTGKGKKKGGAKVVRPVRPNVLANNQDLRPVAKKSGPPKKDHVRAVCSVTDPFCPAAKNTKWPDGTAGNTLTEQFRGNVTITSNATGRACYAFAPGAPYGYLSSAVDTATPPVATMAATYSSYKTTSMLSTYGGAFRVVSFGVIFRCVASATAAAGTITLGTIAGVAPNVTITQGEELYDEVVVKAIQPGMEIAWVSVPRGTGARDFGALSTTAGLNIPDWTCCVAEISGAGNAVAAVNAEWYMNIEFLANQTSRGLTSIAKPNPPRSPAAETATSTIHSTLGSFVEGGIAQVESAIMREASSALTTFTRDPLSSLSALFAFM